MIRQATAMTKLDHMQEMLFELHLSKKTWIFGPVLMDTWYATKEIMLQIEKLNKIYYCRSKTIARWG